MMGGKKIYKYQVRLTKDQYEKLKQNCRMRGFSYLSSYVRFMALDQDMWMSRKISEIHAPLDRARAPTGEFSNQQEPEHERYPTGSFNSAEGLRLYRQPAGGTKLGSKRAPTII